MRDVHIPGNIPLKILTTQLKEQSNIKVHPVMQMENATG